MYHTSLLKSSTSQPLARQILQAPLTQITLELKRLTLPLHLAPHPQAPPQLFLFSIEFLPDSLFILHQFTMVRIQILGHARQHGRAGGQVKLADARDERGHAGHEGLR